jgi:hypothetical protein
VVPQCKTPPHLEIFKAWAFCYDEAAMPAGGAVTVSASPLGRIIGLNSVSIVTLPGGRGRGAPGPANGQPGTRASPRAVPRRSGGIA